MYQKILVPLDGSALAECVFPHLEVLARGCQVKNIVLARVVEPIHAPTGDYVMDPEMIKKFETEHKLAAEGYLKNLAAKTSYPGVALKTDTVSSPLLPTG